MRLSSAALAAALLGMVAAAPSASAQLINFNSTNKNIVQMSKPTSTSIALPTMPKGVSSIFSFFPTLPSLTNHSSVVFTQLPDDKDLPGLDYLKLFGFRPAQRAH
jgi:hypothetical protein